MSDPMPTRPAAGRGGKKAAAATSLVASVAAAGADILPEDVMQRFFRDATTKGMKGDSLVAYILNMILASGPLTKTALAIFATGAVDSVFGKYFAGDPAAHSTFRTLTHHLLRDAPQAAFRALSDIKDDDARFSSLLKQIEELKALLAVATGTAPATPAGATPAHGAPAASTALAGTSPATPAAKVEVKRSLLVLSFVAAFGRSVKLAEADEANEIFQAYPDLVERLALEWYITHFNEKPEPTISGALSLKTEKNLATIRKFTDEEKRETIQILFTTGAGKLSPLTNLEALFNRLIGKKAEADERAPVTEAEDKLAAAVTAGNIVDKVAAEKELKAAKKALKQQKDGEKPRMALWLKAAIGTGAVLGLGILYAVWTIVEGIANLK